MKQDISAPKNGQEISKSHYVVEHSAIQHLFAKNIFKKMHPLAELTAHETKYDFIAYGFRVKVRAATVSLKTNNWRFGIRKNTDCDQFALMAFDNAKDRKLLHMWIVDSAAISHLSSISISEGTLSQWDDCEVDLDGWE